MPVQSSCPHCVQAVVSTADPSPLVAQRPGLDIPINDISTIFGAPGSMIKSDGNSGIQKANDVLRDGKTLEENKGTILYLAGPDATDSEKALLLAMAMLVCDLPTWHAMHICRAASLHVADACKRHSSTHSTQPHGNTALSHDVVAHVYQSEQCIKVEQCLLGLAAGDRSHG